MPFQTRRPPGRSWILLIALLLSAVSVAAGLDSRAQDSPPFLTVHQDIASAGYAPNDVAAPAALAAVVASPVEAPQRTGDPNPRTHRGGTPGTHLRLVKLVRNDGGGGASETGWTLRATGAATESPTNLAGTTPVDSGASFKPDIYALSEEYTGENPEVAAGYSASEWSCADSGTGQPVEVMEGSTVTVRTGDDITCTIVNTYSPPHQPPTVCPPCRITGRKLYFAKEGPLQGVQVGLSGWTVTATPAGSEDLRVTTTTDALGAYEFTREALGEMAYPGAAIEVCEETRPGWIPLTQPCVTVTIPTGNAPASAAPVVDFTNAQDYWMR